MDVEKIRKLPKFEIVKKTKPSWFDKAISNIEKGKSPFASKKTKKKK